MTKDSVPRIGPKKPPRLFIQEWMDKREMTQMDIAARLEVASSGTISKKLANPQKMSAEWLAAFAWALDLDKVTDLYRHPDRPNAEDILAGLDEPRRAIIIEMIQGAKRA